VRIFASFVPNIDTMTAFEYCWTLSNGVLHYNGFVKSV